MSQIDAVTSCSHTPFDHLLHPFCPAQSDLRKVANIAVPLFVVLGTIYYAWRQFNPTISLEQQVDTLIAERKFNDAEKLLKKIPDSAKKDLLSDTLNEARSTDLLTKANHNLTLYPGIDLSNQVCKRDLGEAAEAAKLLKNPTKKESLLEKIFDAYLKITDPSIAFPGAQSILGDFSVVKRDEIRERFVKAAIERVEFKPAFSEGTQLTSESARKMCFVHFAPQIAEAIEDRPAQAKGPVLGIVLKDGTLKEIITILIEKELLAPALDLTADFVDPNEQWVFSEKIIQAYIQKRELLKAYEPMRKSPSKHETLIRQLVEAALEQNNIVVAVQAFVLLSEKNTKEQLVDRLANQVVENLTEVMNHTTFPQTLWLDILFGHATTVLIKKNELESAQKLAEKIQNTETRDRGIKVIFKTYLDQENLQKARVVVGKISKKETRDELRQELIDQAMGKSKPVFAANVTTHLGDKSERTKNFDRLVPILAVDPTNLIHDALFPKTEQADELFVRMIPLLLAKKDFTNAEALANKIHVEKTKTGWLRKIKEAEPAKSSLSEPNVVQPGIVDSFEDIFTASLQKEDLAQAEQIIKDLNDQDRKKELIPLFVSAALKNGKPEWLIKAAHLTYILGDESKRNDCFDLLAPPLVDNLGAVLRSKQFLNTAVFSNPIAMDGLLERMIPLLIKKEAFSSAHLLANDIYIQAKKESWVKKINEAHAKK